MDSWGYDRRDSDPYHTMPELLEQLAATVAYGGNLLLNVYICILVCADG